MLHTAPKGYIYCVSWYWLNAPSISVSRFWATELEELPDRYKFFNAIIPRTYLQDGKLYVKPQIITPEDLDKQSQAVFIFKVPKELWMDGSVPMLDAVLSREPSAEIQQLSEDLLGLLAF